MIEQHALTVGLMTGTLAVIAGARAQPATYPALHPVGFRNVQIDDEFWAPRQRTNRRKTVPHVIRQCERTGRISNFAKAAGLIEGKFEGTFFNDSDVYKTLEGAAYTLAGHRDEALEKKVDAIISQIAAAQQEDGYLNTYYTLVEPDKRWTDLPVRHELYCAGHLFEAGVAYYKATGKRTLLDVARRFADHIDRIFGPGKRLGVPGHEEIELALVKLYRATGEQRYRKLAEFFLEARGKGGPKYVHMQDHLPIRRQSEMVGHAVRAMYLYSGVADIVALSGDRGYADALERLWRNVVFTKMYVTGGIGSTGRNEGFTGNYDLPNEAAYCETCASIGMVFWNHRLLMLHGDGRFADVLERVLYNGLLAGVGLDGEHFFYVNPLASRGRHHRQPWYGTACCPTNVVRFIPALGDYIYATSDDGLWVTLYMGGTATAVLKSGDVRVTQETRYPWSGEVEIKIAPEAPAEFAVHLRIPAWCDRFDLAVNGEALKAIKPDKGYVRIERTWKPGDVIKLDLPMEVQRIEAHPAVKADAGRVALQRGPIVYCFEAIDNGGRVRNLALPRNATFETLHQPDLLDGVTVIKTRGLARPPADWEGRLYQQVTRPEPVEITAVPYHAWDHREPGEMIVWIPESVGLADAPAPPSLADGAKVSASHVQGDLAALNDGIEPAHSNDQTVPRFTWWDHKGATAWVEYTFGAPQRVSSSAVYWFDDISAGGGCAVPKSWRILWKDGQKWRPVTGASGYPTAADTFNHVTFDPVVTKQLRIEAQLQPDRSAGILEWRLSKTEGAN